MSTLRQDADAIIQRAFHDASPDAAVKHALVDLPEVRGRLALVAIGKAAWQMANAAYETLGARIDSGVVVTKTGHARGPIGELTVLEGGHPIPDARSYAAADAVLRLVDPLGPDDLVLFLVSGGGSALFEKPSIPPEETQDITQKLLARGADIVEINTVRKRLSDVKGGRFAQRCAPARVFSVVLSDVLGDRLDMIASGPAYPDASTREEAFAIAAKYGLKLSDSARDAFERETPKTLERVETRIVGSVRQLCASAEAACRELGYEPVVLTDRLSCEAREAGSFLASVARFHANSGRSLAFIAGGETVVHVTGTGLGGRNQEIALGAATGLAGLSNCAVFSAGSDGTDGPTDAAGGFCSGESYAALKRAGIDPVDALRNNDAYHALQAIGGLIITGPTGTNVNDLSCALIKK